MGAQFAHLYEQGPGLVLKSELARYLAVSRSLDATVERLRTRYGVGFVVLDPNGANFWLALADLLHQYGLDHEATFRIARGLIDDGTDLRIMKERGASDADLRARGRALTKLRAKWDTPPARIRKVPALKPEPFVMQAGDVFSYATMQGNPRTPEQVGIKGPRAFRRDATNAFVCFNTARVFFDTEARYFILPLALFRREGPVTLPDAVGAQFITHCEMDARKFQPLGGWMAWDRKVLAAVAPKKIGEVDAMPAALERLFGQSVHAPLSRHDGPEYPLWMNYGILSNIVRAHVWGDAEDRLECFVKAWRSVEG